MSSQRSSENGGAYDFPFSPFQSLGLMPRRLRSSSCLTEFSVVNVSCSWIVSKCYQERRSVCLHVFAAGAPVCKPPRYRR